jgi:eukaryotic-like serine/threonine-protein kinase
MELLEGEDLAALLGRQGPLPVEQAVDFVLQACVAIANAHALGIVHRDLKPANLFCVRGFDGQPVVKVLDFGISKMGHLPAPEVGGSMTNTTAVMGSPFYMSPEQMKSARDVDAGTDIWALGVILYELLTGVTPFAGESFAEVAIKAATAPLTPLANLRATVPSGLEAVAFKCLEKDRNDRYANVSELALALASYGSPRARPFVDRIVRIAQASGLPASPPQPASSEAARGLLGTMAPSASTAPGVVRGQRGSRRTRTLAIAGVGSLCVAIAVGTVIAVKRSLATSALATPASLSPGVTAAVNVDRGAPGAARASTPVPPTAASPVALSTAAQPSAEASTTAAASVDAVRGPTPAPPASSTPSHVGSARAVQRPSATHDSESKAGNPPGAGNCRVISFFDADGNQHFKQQCGK